MKTVFSPRELARAIGVSESSLKRWVDDGRLEVTRTPGGHRRIPFEAAVRFLRDNELELADPAALGLTEVARVSSERATEDPADLLHELLIAGDAEAARSLVLTSFIKGASVAEICDGALRDAMSKIGTLWRDDPKGIFVEHRATDICLEILRSLRLGLRIEEDAPLAVGGAPEGDPYAIPSLMAATVLGSLGFKATNLGPDTPADTFLRAAKETGAGLVWVSVSSVADAGRLGQHLAWLARELALIDADLIVGGRDLERLGLGDDLPHRFFGDTMTDLAGLGRRILAARA